MLFDTHCHIHESEFFDRKEQQAVYNRAVAADVKMICVSTSEKASREAIEFCQNHEDAWAIVGVHPHEAKDGYAEVGELLASHAKSIIGIGEIGLDYFYMHSDRDTQIAALEQQLQWASDYQLPVSFHVREAFDDFWPIFNNFKAIKGILHSFTDNLSNMERGLSHGLCIGVNGISTFTKDAKQQEMYDSIPLKHMLFETDAPFLTPTPHRGKVNEPAYVRLVAEYHARRRNIEIDELASITTHSAKTLFSI